MDRCQELITARDSLTSSDVHKYLKAVAMNFDMPRFPTAIEMAMTDVLKSDAAASALVSLVDNHLRKQLIDELQLMKIRQDSIQQNLKRAHGNNAKQG